MKLKKKEKFIITLSHKEATNLEKILNLIITHGHNYYDNLEEDDQIMLTKFFELLPPKE